MGDFRAWVKDTYGEMWVDLMAPYEGNFDEVQRTVADKWAAFDPDEQSRFYRRLYDTAPEMVAPRAGVLAQSTALTLDEATWLVIVLAAAPAEMVFRAFECEGIDYGIMRLAERQGGGFWIARHDGDDAPRLFTAWTPIARFVNPQAAYAFEDWLDLREAKTREIEKRAVELALKVAKPRRNSPKSAKHPAESTTTEIDKHDVDV